MSNAALVTGGTRGVGRGIARALVSAGWQVAICGRKSPEEPVEGALFLPCDVRAADQAAALVEDVARRFGRLDLLVNNAGGSPAAVAATASPRFSESIIQLNLLAPLHLAQAANRIMQGQESGGTIVNIASISGTRPSPGTAAYGAAKAGLLNLTQSLAMEWGPKVRVNAILAGLIETESADLHYGSPEAVQRIGATLPLGRMAVPEDIAAAVLYLASPAASYVSGAQLAVHGGGERPGFLALADAAH